MVDVLRDLLGLGGRGERPAEVTERGARFGLPRAKVRADGKDQA
jgi:hypothetical protein